MWGYYGSKSKIIKYYPEPKFNTIIEPFCGTAQYSLKYWDKNVILFDKYEIIINLWKWLQKCSKDDILSIRELKFGESTDNFKWNCKEEKDLVGFIICGAPSAPRKKATKWKTELRPNTQKYKKKIISENLEKIRHWDIRLGCYKQISNVEATWFVDPPYKKGGEHYIHGSKKIDYNHLSKWCKKRLGQVIVCEGEGADWLPFKHLLSSRGNSKNYKEYIWTND